MLLISGSPRSEHTCPGEMSKTWRLARIARESSTAQGFEVDVLDLSRLTSEYGRVIHPCKALRLDRDAALPLAVLCYPNHALGQAGTG